MTAADTMTKMREEVFGAIRTFTAATVAEAEQATSAILRIAYNESPYPLSAQQREPVVRVKELEWRQSAGSKDDPVVKGACWADTSLGRYIARESTIDGSGWFLIGQAVWNRTESIDAAKSAAQADYEARIMAAVEIQSSDGGIMDAARKAKARVDTWSDAKKDFAERAMLPSDHASGWSQPSPDVSVDELEAFIGSLEPDSMAVARALLARFRSERLDRLASSGRRG